MIFDAESFGRTFRRAGLEFFFCGGRLSKFSRLVSSVEATSVFKGSCGMLMICCEEVSIEDVVEEGGGLF